MMDGKLAYIVNWKVYWSSAKTPCDDGGETSYSHALFVNIQISRLKLGQMIQLAYLRISATEST